MKQFMGLLCGTLFLFWSCDLPFDNGDFKSTAKEKNGVKLVCWNLQTFFDSQTSGNEYYEFLNSANWNEEKYKVRVSRLCDFITANNADVYVFEEVENEGILYDITNALAGYNWNSSRLWNYGAFSREDGSAIGVAVLSRLPLESLKLHSMDVRCQKEDQPGGRPLMELKILNGENRLTVFVNHWKSKSNDNGNSEIWRNWQEAVLLDAIQNLNEDDCYIACGDFNKDINEFAFNKAVWKVNLRGITGACLVNTPWLDDNGNYSTVTGSYYYKERWERIDHFFYSDNVKLWDFRALGESPWATEDGIPVAYKLYNGNGYSDHLGISCYVSF